MEVRRIFILFACASSSLASRSFVRVGSLSRSIHSGFLYLGRFDASPCEWSPLTFIIAFYLYSQLSFRIPELLSIGKRDLMMEPLE